MQSDGNNFCRNIVLDSFNNATQDEDNIKDKYIKANFFGILL